VKYFEENGLKIKSISAGLYHCNAIDTKGDLYSWGRGLYGVLGNGSNSHALEPMLNEDVAAIQEENGKIVKLDSADEYSVIQLEDGTIHAWGKNDSGQMGTGTGIGIDMVECENQPTYVNLLDENDQPKNVKDFVMGQSTMLI
jgi:alpha-tubulin suppressor-like RCC1 family protein